MLRGFMKIEDVRLYSFKTFLEIYYITYNNAHKKIPQKRFLL